MDLSNIVIPEGAVPAPMVTCVVEGILEEADLRELTLSTKLGAEPIAEEENPADLKKIREKHHSVARMIAGGLQQRMVSQLCGYSESYLSVLLNNPSMLELVELYRIQLGASATIVTEKLKTVGLKAIEQLEERVDEGKMSTNELTGVAKLGLDRGGHGPQTKHHNVNEDHLIDHAELTRLNHEARQRSASHIVPASEVRAALPSPESIDSETNQPLDSQSTELDEDRQHERLP